MLHSGGMNFLHPGLTSFPIQVQHVRFMCSDWLIVQIKHCTFVSQYKSKSYENTCCEPAPRLRLPGLVNSTRPEQALGMQPHILQHNSSEHSSSLLQRAAAGHSGDKCIPQPQMPSPTGNPEEPPSLISLIRVSSHRD